MSLVPELKQFMAKTIATTYASGQGKVEQPQRPAFEEYHFSDGEWEYRDSYFGGALSWGQENIFKSKQPVWSLVYGGGITEPFRNDKALEKKSFSCMKQALLVSRQGDDFLPRGPRCLRWEDCVYTADWQGDITWFRGQEKVYLNDELVHIYDFAGGLYIP